MVVWVKHGSTVRKRLVPYQPDFCIHPDQDTLEKAENLLALDQRVGKVWRDESRLWLRGEQQEVLRVRTKRLQDLHAVATQLRRDTNSKGYTFYDVDNQPESRWMHEQGLWSMCRLKLDDTGKPTLNLAQEDVEKRFEIDYPDPELTTTHLHVIVDEEGTKRDIVNFSDPLLAIQLGDQVFQVGTLGDEDEERGVLRAFGRALMELDPDIIFTKHGDRFDIPYLLTRIQQLGLREQVQLGRDEDPMPSDPDQAGKSIHTYGRWLYKTSAYYLKGRWHIDLSKKTLDSEDERKDIHGILYLTRIANRRAQDINRNGAGYALQQMQIDRAVDMEVAIPWKRNLSEDWKDAATLCAVDRGGQIMVPTPGIYGDVAACDFSGYYPSLIVHHNLSSDTINCDCCPDGPIVPELNYHLCLRTQGHQAGVLGQINQHRKWAKGVIRRAKSKGDVDGNELAKAQAIKSEQKAIGVVCFGYFRYRNARFGCAEVHQAIQCYGRKGMTDAKRVAEESGYEMVHAMTDCTFLHKPGITRADATRITRLIANQVGVVMDLEGVYKWVVFLPSKVHSKSAPGTVGVPNRYYGKFDDGKMKVRGIEVQRHSTPGWIWDTQKGMLDVLSQADTPSEFHLLIPRALSVAEDAAHELRRRAVAPERLATMVQATREVEEYQADTNTRTALLRLRDMGTERKPGEYVKYVVTRHDGPKESRVVPIELFGQGSPWFGDADVTYHVEHYLRLLARSVETILAPFGLWEDTVMKWLAGRAENPYASRNDRVDIPERPEWVRT